jgi:hypothetical protein
MAWFLVKHRDKFTLPNIHLHHWHTMTTEKRDQMEAEIVYLLYKKCTKPNLSFLFCLNHTDLFCFNVKKIM